MTTAGEVPTPLSSSARHRNGTRLVPGSGGDTLLLSMRGIADLVAFCLQYEFEDVITELTGADRIDVGDRAALDLSRRAYKVARFASGSRRLAWACAPEVSTVRLERDYELFFPVFNNAYELFALAAVPDWRRRSRVAACYINEVWASDLPGYLLELLAQFDHVFLGTRNAVEDVARIAGRPCSYLPLAVDVLRFSPGPQALPRVIDVCNIGRRSPVTHEALMRMARDREIFYYHDTIVASGFDQKQRTFRVDEPSEHRLLLASLLQRTRYFVANRALVNEGEVTMGRDEMSGRFYEGAAAGAIMLGEPPRTREFEKQFNWTDAVIPLPFDSPDIRQVLVELDADPQRLSRIRQDNVRNAALRHDWVYRLRAVFEVVGIPPTDAMLERQARLRALAGVGPGSPVVEDCAEMFSAQRSRRRAPDTARALPAGPW